MADSINTQDLPEAVVTEKSSFSLIWLIPLVALAIGAWLVFVAQKNRGPDITIGFSNAAGLEIGKTRLKYKDVEVGKVMDIQLSEDLAEVLVTVRLTRSAGEHLTDNARFWIVRPRISSNGVSGLNTLISGVHISMEPGDGENDVLDYYEGLDEPPFLESETPGTPFTLTANSLASLDVGSPIYYRQIKVGEVTEYDLVESGRTVNIGVYIYKPYDQLVRRNSRFWNASGFNFDLSSQGISAKLESLTALMSGGISFDTPLNLEDSPAAEAFDAFVLYPDFASTSERQFNYTLFYVMHFNGSLRGLHPGAPIEYHGIKVGEVRDIKVEMDPDTYEVDIPVLAAFQPERFSLSESAVGHPQEALEALVSRGLRAQLKPGNLITGQMYIDLDIYPDAAPAVIAENGRYPVFPTVEAALDTITRSVTDLAAKVDQMPLLEITQNLNETVKGLKKIANAPESASAIKNLDKALASVNTLATTANQHADPMMKELLESLENLSTTLNTVERTIAEDSSLYHDVSKMVTELSEAARSIKDFTDFLQRRPDALIFGKDNLSR